MAGLEIPAELPSAFLPQFRSAGCVETTLTDPPHRTEGGRKEEAWRYARAQVHKVHALIFPRLGIRT
jgi:hypothetical protein